jgi:leucyl-tRNA synthetase
MELVNALYAYKFHSNDGGISKEVYKTVLLLMSPFTPHLCEEIWESLGNKEFISASAFPASDENLIKEHSIEIPVQVNGKIKGKIIVPADIAENEAKKIAETDIKISAFIKNKQVVKFIYVKNKIMTFVVK